MKKYIVFIILIVTASLSYSQVMRPFETIEEPDLETIFYTKHIVLETGYYTQSNKDEFERQVRDFLRKPGIKIHSIDYEMSSLGDTGHSSIIYSAFIVYSF